MLKKISSKLESLFDQSGPSLALPETPAYQNPKTGFEAENNLPALENLSYIFNGEIKHDQLLLLFGQLKPHFEAGFLLERKGTPDFRATEAFAFGNKVRTENFKSLKLPATGVFRILKIAATPLLKRFGLEAVDPDNQMTSYLIPLSQNCGLVMTTRLAEPWALLKIETLQKTLMKINFSL